MRYTLNGSTSKLKVVIAASADALIIQKIVKKRLEFLREPIGIRTIANQMIKTDSTGTLELCAVEQTTSQT